ncbi:MAG TPA: redoxin domain-containing protein [Blastocatellia bacterium]|nr:redoxin domain-containing protein [Blastocatellia bacterium]
MRVLPALLILVALSGCEPKSVTEQAKSQPAQGQKATPTPRSVSDFDIEMINPADGQSSTVKLSNLVKGKVVVIDFWATWCGPCKKEIPNLIALQREYQDQGVEVIGLHTRSPEVPKEEVIAMYKDMNFNYKIGYTSNEMFLAFTNNDSVIPQTFIFGKDGVLVKRFRGAGQGLAALKTSVEKALGTASQS